MTFNSRDIPSLFYMFRNNHHPNQCHHHHTSPNYIPMSDKVVQFNIAALTDSQRFHHHRKYCKEKVIRHTSIRLPTRTTDWGYCASSTYLFTIGTTTIVVDPCPIITFFSTNNLSCNYASMQISTVVSYHHHIEENRQMVHRYNSTLPRK